MKQSILILFCMLVMNSFAQEPIGIFKSNADIGSPKLAGSASFDESDQTYTILGAGYNIWFGRDEFHYLYNKLKGDFILTANFAFVGDNPVHRKIGWMVRASDKENAVHCSAVLHGDGLTTLQWRVLENANMRDPQDEIRGAKPFYSILQLERSGKTMIMRAAHPSEPLQLIGKTVMENMPDDVLAGLIMCSHDPDVIETAKIWNVRIDQPVAGSYDPNKEGWLGCRMETMNVFDGKRKVIMDKASRFEAPNWMPDGKKLLFNMDGSIYKMPVEGGELEKLNTGSAKNSNNDHCISFDGKMLGISSHRAELNGGGSIIYVLPLEGGEPQLVTQETPSYLHGWAANNKEVVYVAQRNGSNIYNIYQNSIKGNTEIALTDNKPGEHVDGCEYSPDGKYIYYNGSQSGTMQLWRMKPDGTEKEQLTFDEYNNWFPHISPDGKWIAFISFLPEIEFNSHPSYKHVMLRLMPVSGGAPKVIAYMYGGQGTINVNSWSPDSKHIAFVSNSGKK